MFISTAYAQGAGAPAGGGLLEMFLPLILIFVIFYFLLIRPQQKKQKEHQAKLSAVRRGDKVIMGGGIKGTVVKVIEDDDIMVRIADGVEVRVLKATLIDVLAKTEPVKDKDSKKSKSKKDAEKDDVEDSIEDDEDASETVEEKTPANDSGAKKGGLGSLFGKK